MNKEIKTYERKNMQRNAKEITKMMDNKTALFGNAVQRGLCWTQEMKSLLIHSMILKMPVPAMYAIHADKEKTYDFLDGKQRCNAIHDYLHGVYALKDVPPIEYEDGTFEDINGRYFSGLSEDMQDNIASYSLTIYYLEDIPEEATEEIFYRLNHGKNLTNIEVSRVKCKAIHQVQVLTKHPVFDGLSAKARKRYTDEDIVVKCLAMLDMDEPCLDTKAIRPYMENLVIDDEKRKMMMGIFSDIKQMHDEIEKDSGKIARRLYVKTHMISIVPFVKEHGKQTEFLQKFFSGEKMSISQKYNEHATAGVGHVPNVKARMDAINEEWKRFKSH